MKTLVSQGKKGLKRILKKKLCKFSYDKLKIDRPSRKAINEY